MKKDINVSFVQGGKLTKGGWLSIVAFLLVVVLALSVALGLVVKSNKKDKTAEEASVNDSFVVEADGDDGGSGIMLSAFEEIPRANYAAYGISPMALDARTVKATIEGDNTQGLKLQWTLSWKEGTSGKFGYNKSVSDYVTGSASQDTLTYTLSCSQAFGETIVLKVALEIDPSKTLTRSLQYKQTFEDLTGSIVYTNASSSGSNLTWTLGSGTSVVAKFPGTATTTDDFNRLYGATGSGTTSFTVKTALSGVYTLPATVTDVKAEVSPASGYRTAVTGAGGTLATAAGSYVSLGTGTGQNASIATKFANILLLTSTGGLNFNTLKTSLKALGASETMISIRLSATVNGKAQTKTYSVRFDADSFGAIGGNIGWTDDGGDIVFGG